MFFDSKIIGFDLLIINLLNLDLLKQFLQVEDLKCATLDIVNNNFTREDSFSSRSFIDHFIVNNNILYSNIDAGMVRSVGDWGGVRTF